MKTQLMESERRHKLLSEFDPALILFMEIYWIYVLKNRKDGKLYYGYTNNLERRLKEHDIKTTWKFIGCEGYASELDVRERERKLKHYGQARTHLKNRLKKSFEQ